MAEQLDVSMVKLTEAQEKSAILAFDKYDKREEGQIKVGDVLSAMRAIGKSVKAEWMEKHEEHIDPDGTGFLDKNDFLTLIKLKEKEEADERDLRDLFRVLAKKQEEVPVSDLRWILKELSDLHKDMQLSEEDIDDMIAEVDTDGSGWVDYDEFFALMTS